MKIHAQLKNQAYNQRRPGAEASVTQGIRRDTPNGGVLVGHL